MSRAARALLAAAALLAPAFGAAWAQEPALPSTCEGVALETRVFKVRYKPLFDAAQLVDQLLGPCGSYKVPKSLKVVVVEDEPGRLGSIAGALSSWDLPPAAVDVSVSLIIASIDDEERSDERASPRLAAELAEINRALADTTRWTRYHRLGTASVRVMEGGEAELELTEKYKVVVRVGAVDSDRGFVQIEPYTLLRVPAKAETGTAISPPRRVLGGDLNLEEGRTHLIGTPSHSRRRAIFLAFTVWSTDGREPLRLEGEQ